MGKESEKYKAVKKEAARLREAHDLDPNLHAWVPMRIASFGKSGTEMLLGCRCGAFVWIPAKEVSKY